MTAPDGYPVAIGEPPSPDKVDRMTQAVYGHDVKFHAIGIPLCANAGDPDQQARGHINMLFKHANSGKPHLLPEAERLLQAFKAYKHREVLAQAKQLRGGRKN
jgi:hypothetical protein